MFKNLFWWLVEIFIWVLFFYTIFFTIKNIADVSIGWMSFLIVLIGSFGIFASPLTRHLSMWHKILDREIEKGNQDD